MHTAGVYFHLDRALIEMFRIEMNIRGKIIEAPFNRRIVLDSKKFQRAFFLNKFVGRSFGKRLQRNNNRKDKEQYGNNEGKGFRHNDLLNKWKHTSQNSVFMVKMMHQRRCDMQHQQAY